MFNCQHCIYVQLSTLYMFNCQHCMYIHTLLFTGLSPSRFLFGLCLVQYTEVEEWRKACHLSHEWHLGYLIRSNGIIHTWSKWYWTMTNKLVLCSRWVSSWKLFMCQMYTTAVFSLSKCYNVESFCVYISITIVQSYTEKYQFVVVCIFTSAQHT